MLYQLPNTLTFSEQAHEKANIGTIIFSRKEEYTKPSSITHVYPVSKHFYFIHSQALTIFQIYMFTQRSVLS